MVVGIDSLKLILCQTTETAVASRVTRKANREVRKVDKADREATVKAPVPRTAINNKQEVKKNSSKKPRAARERAGATRVKGKVAADCIHSIF